jgi:hypothetical protein
MKRLILTTSDSSAGCLQAAEIADKVIGVGYRFAAGPLLSEAELAESFASFASFGLADLGDRFDAIDLWIDPDPNAQLILVWLLECFRPHDAIVSKLNLVQADISIGELMPERLLARRFPAIKIGGQQLELASSAWRAWRQPTPQDWFGLLSSELGALPLFRPATVTLLEELPGRASGLGATEMRMLELISEGIVDPFDVFPGHEKRNTRRVFGYWETGTLLERMARGPAPALSGLKEGPFTLDMHDDRGRHQRYKQSKLSLTALGRDILAGREDFTRHNPVHRWWGGTELTNEQLWRWDAAKQVLVEP